jgi:hypothetical protein
MQSIFKINFKIQESTLQNPQNSKITQKFQVLYITQPQTGKDRIPNTCNTYNFKIHFNKIILNILLSLTSKLDLTLL